MSYLRNNARSNPRPTHEQQDDPQEDTIKSEQRRAEWVVNESEAGRKNPSPKPAAKLPVEELAAFWGCLFAAVNQRFG
jgi:hypothetical protein